MRDREKQWVAGDDPADMLAFVEPQGSEGGPGILRLPHKFVPATSACRSRTFPTVRSCVTGKRPQDEVTLGCPQGHKIKIW
jgi:hypothetical protein